jgi:ABC-type transport system involved in multi-copper enzyme maturation permease subunit
MSSKVVAQSPDDAPLPDGWRGHRETAPSLLRKDEPQFARWVGLIGLMLVTLGSIAMFGSAIRIGSRPFLGSLFAITGLACLLFHAFRDADVQVRRIYGVLGLVWLAAAALATLLPIKGPPGTQFLPYGFLFLTLALFFLLPFARHETDERWRKITLMALGGIGAVLATTGFIGGNFSENFLIPYTLVLTILGLAYLWAFIGLEGIASEVGYRAALGLGGAGLLVFLVALGRSLFHPRTEPYLVPSGLLLMLIGLLYGGLALGLSSDNRLVVLVRRELAAFFYSPIAYIVLFGFTLLAWWQYWTFIGLIADAPLRGGEPLVEPVISYYILSWITVISMIVVIPAVTMRLLSEERRTGSLEVLLTAPLKESTVVISKFVAALVFFLVLWVPWGLFLIALRIDGGETFDYRPLLSFLFALAATGAGMLGMGLFFSSLTRHQILAFVLTFVGMIPLTFIYFLNRELAVDSAWRTILTYISYVHLWIESVQGTLSPRYLVFHISAAILWLFLTVKVLEARKWS